MKDVAPSPDDAEAVRALERWLVEQTKAPTEADAAWQQHRLRRRRLLSVNFDRVTKQ
jgi:hypothetical protein